MNSMMQISIIKCRLNICIFTLALTTIFSCQKNENTESTVTIPTSNLSDVEATVADRFSVTLKCTSYLTDKPTNAVGFEYTLEDFNGNKVSRILSVKDTNGTFTSTLSIIAGQNYQVRAFQIVGDIVYVSNPTSFCTDSININVLDINIENLTIRASIEDAASLTTSIKYGICYSETHNPTIKSHVVYSDTIDENGCYNVTITNYTFDKHIYYRAFMIYDGVAYYSREKDFKTKSIQLEAKNIDDDNYITVVTNIFSDTVINSKLKKYGVVYGETPNLTWNNNQATLNKKHEEHYLVQIKDIYSTIVYYRPFALIDNTVYYGEVKSFQSKIQIEIEDFNTSTFELTVKTNLHEILKSEHVQFNINVNSNSNSIECLGQKEYIFGLKDLGNYTFEHKNIVKCSLFYNDVSYSSSYDFEFDDINLEVGNIDLDTYKITSRINAPKEIINQITDCGISYSGNSWGRVKSNGVDSNGNFYVNLSFLNDNDNWNYVNYSAYFTIGKLTFISNKLTQYITRKFAVPEIVDLGLSVKWASFNLGAYIFSDYGRQYAWADKSNRYFNEDSYTYYASFGDVFWILKYCNKPDLGRQDNLNQIEPDDDAATVNLGNGWRIPTAAEWKELINSCTWKWDFANQCFKVTGRNGNYIYLPKLNYWSSTLYEENPYNAICAVYRSKYTGQYEYYIEIDNKLRFEGFYIRPVYQ